MPPVAITATKMLRRPYLSVDISLLCFIALSLFDPSFRGGRDRDAIAFQCAGYMTPETTGFAIALIANAIAFLMQFS